MKWLAVVLLLAACSKPQPPPKPPDKVAIGVDRAPEGTLVYDNWNVLLGSAPGVVMVPRGIEPYTLNFRNPKFGWEKRTVIPMQDQKLSVPMRNAYDRDPPP